MVVYCHLFEIFKCNNVYYRAFIDNKYHAKHYIKITHRSWDNTNLRNSKVIVFLIILTFPKGKSFQLEI